MSTVQGDIGVVVGLNEAELQRGVGRVAQALNDLAATVERLGARIDKAMKDATTQAEQASQRTKQLTEEEKKAAEAAKAAAEARKRQAAEEKKAKEEARAAARAAKEAEQEAARAAREHEKAAERAAREHKQALNDMRQGLQHISAAAAVVAAGIAAVAKVSSDAYKAEQSAFLGLESVAQKTIGSVTEAKDAVQALTQDGLMTLVEASKAVQAGLATGFNLQETVDLINAFRDAAAFNRQAGLEFGEAVVRAMEGVRMGNSVLSDAAGITKNLSQILKEAGYAEQDLMRVSSDAAVRRALYNGILKEGALFTGNAAKAADTLAGAESRAGTEAFNAKAAVGEALAPAMQALAEAITNVLGKLSAFVETNPELARTALLVAGGMAAVTAAVGSLAVAFLALNTALGPVGWSLLGIGAAIGAIAGLAVSLESGGKAAAKQKTELDNLVSEYRSLVSTLQDATTSQEEHRKASERLQQVLDELRKINPDLVEGLRLQEAALDSYNQKLQDSINRMELFRGLWLGLRLALAQMNPSVAAALAPEVYAPRPQSPPAPEDMGKPSPVSNLPKGGGSSAGSGSGVGPGDSKMSPALTAALEDLQDLQALEKTPDNLKATLEKVRRVIDEHYGELSKLGRLRDLERLRDITLPKELRQAEFNEAMKALQFDEQMAQTQGKPLPPEVVRQRLQAIQQQFDDYLKEHPDAAATIKLRIAGASADELRAPLEEWRKKMRENEQLGIYSSPDGLRFKRRDLQEGLSIALGAGDRAAYIEIVGQIQQIDKALQQANFEGKFDRIRQSRERAFAGAAETLAELQKRLIDAEAADDTELAASIKKQMLDAVRPALEEEKKALEELLKDETLTAEQRAQVEAELNRVKGELYDQDVSAHRIAVDAKTAAERQAAKERQEAERNMHAWLQAIAKADLDSIRERQRAEEERAQEHIRNLQEELQQLERQWAAEDRRKRIDDLKAELDEVLADTSFQKVVDGKLVWTYDEARARELQKQIDEAEKEDARARERERLQDQIDAAQERLDRMRESHQRELEERQEFWNNLQSLDLSQYEDLVKAASQGLDNWTTVVQSKLGELQRIWEETAKAIEDAARRISSALSGSGASSPPPAPTLPPSLIASMGGVGAGLTVNVERLEVPLPNVTDPQQFMERLPGAAATAGVDVQQLVLTGRARLRTV